MIVVHHASTTFIAQMYDPASRAGSLSSRMPCSLRPCVRGEMVGSRSMSLPESILVVTGAQILFLDIPDHAAVNACVQAVRLDPASQAFAALANAVARNVARQRDEHESDDPFVDTPTWLASRWRKTYGDEA